MKKITTEETLKYTKNLSLLYVEDDLNLQNQTAELLRLLFKSVTTADDGLQALNLYKKKSFDIVISDVKMPHMSGIELTKEIKKINSHQTIIITSAFNDSEFLLEFINLNIQQFLYKPVEIQNILYTLYSASKNIINERMIEEYRKELEIGNETLKSKNSELESLVRILESKLIQISQNNLQKSISNFDNAIISPNDLNELKEIEIDISGAATLLNLSNNISISNIKILAQMFKSYADALANYRDYSDLKNAIENLSEILNNTPESFIKRTKEVAILLESFIYVLKIWRQSIEVEDIQKAFDFHTSMINDINTIIAIINGTENEIENQMEFF